MNTNHLIIDVREKDEFLAEHVEGSINVPLSDFEQMAPTLLRELRHRPLMLMCRSGNRATLAQCSLERMGVPMAEGSLVFAGGLSAWSAAGKPTVKAGKSVMPIMRQVQLAAGSVVFAASILAMTVHGSFAGVAAFVGGGLMFAGLTGHCGLAMALAKAPWNRVKKTEAAGASRQEA